MKVLTPVPTDPFIAIEFTRAEAVALNTVARRIGGSPTFSSRQLFLQIERALKERGLTEEDKLATDPKYGAIYFAE